MQVEGGLYYNEGFNDKICSVIKYLFNERLKYKNEKDENGNKKPNPLQAVFKLVMNASYGKTIQKSIPFNEKSVGNPILYINSAITNTYVQVENYRLNQYIHDNYFKIHSIETIVGGTESVVKYHREISTHYNRAHCGSMVLSYSKLIMSEVMVLSQQIGCKILYTDTDSMQVSREDLQRLVPAYREKYQRELIGKNMGQFHVDFSLKGCKSPYATRGIYIGKKSYLCELEGEDAEGNLKKGWHVRLKGIPERTIHWTAEQLGLDLWQLYEKMANANKEDAVQFDLTQNNTEIALKFHGGRVECMQKFQRGLSFGNTKWDKGPDGRSVYDIYKNTRKRIRETATAPNSPYLPLPPSPERPMEPIPDSFYSPMDGASVTPPRPRSVTFHSPPSIVRQRFMQAVEEERERQAEEPTPTRPVNRELFPSTGGSPGIDEVFVLGSDLQHERAEQ